MTARQGGPRRSAPLKPNGSLADTDFAELVHELHVRRWTGVATLSNMGVVKAVTVRDGRTVFASSSSPDDRLGELLLRRGRITLRQFVDAGSAIAPGKRLGTILVEQGILTPKGLVKAVIEQVQEILYGAFQWTEGSYRLEEGREPAAEAITLKISTPDMILEGIRRIEAWSRVARGVGGLHVRYERSSAYEDVLREMRVSFEKLSILTALNQPATVEEICAESSLTNFEVCRTLWAYRVIGVVRRLDAPGGPAAPVEEDEGLGTVLADE